MRRILRHTLSAITFTAFVSMVASVPGYAESSAVGKPSGGTIKGEVVNENDPNTSVKAGEQKPQAGKKSPKGLTTEKKKRRQEPTGVEHEDSWPEQH